MPAIDPARKDGSPVFVNLHPEIEDAVVKSEQGRANAFMDNIKAMASKVFGTGKTPGEEKGGESAPGPVDGDVSKLPQQPEAQGVAENTPEDDKLSSGGSGNPPINGGDGAGGGGGNGGGNSSEPTPPQQPDRRNQQPQPQKEEAMTLFQKFMLGAMVMLIAIASFAVGSMNKLAWPPYIQQVIGGGAPTVTSDTSSTTPGKVTPPNNSDLQSNGKKFGAAFPYAEEGVVYADADSNTYERHTGGHRVCEFAINGKILKRVFVGDLSKPHDKVATKQMCDVEAKKFYAQHKATSQKSSS